MRYQEAEYVARLATRAAEFAARYPNKYAEIRQHTLDGLSVGMPLKWKRDGYPETVKVMMEEAVIEAVRAYKGWPTLRQWVQIEQAKGGC